MWKFCIVVTCIIACGGLWFGIWLNKWYNDPGTYPRDWDKISKGATRRDVELVLFGIDYDTYTDEKLEDTVFTESFCLPDQKWNKNISRNVWEIIVIFDGGEDYQKGVKKGEKRLRLKDKVVKIRIFHTPDAEFYLFPYPHINRWHHS